MEKLEYVIEDSTIAEVLGVQNFSNESSAILELVKNAYDAQSPDVVITISADRIVVEDHGIGMNEQVIRSAWMHVGISNKGYLVGEGDSFRILAGSKGVGRFAIARLGSKASVFTKMQNGKAIVWKTDWKASTLSSSPEDKEPGTKIVIEQLRDNWTEARVRNLRNFLSRTYHDDKMKILLEYKGTRTEVKRYFTEMRLGVHCVCAIFLNYDAPAQALICNIRSDEFKEDVRALCPGIDIYNQTVRLDMREELKALKTELSEDSSDEAWSELLRSVGSFSAELYFSLKGSSSSDLEKFHYKYKSLDERYDDGVILYRNAFSIASYEGKRDWLAFGKRSRISPAAATHPSGAWRVRENQISGKVVIDKQENHELVDLMNRQGLVENDHYQLFIAILIAGVNCFERYRQGIIRQIVKAENKEKGESAPRVIPQVIKKPEKLMALSSDETRTFLDELTKLQQENRQSRKQIDETERRYRYDIRLLNIFATSGLKATSIAHEMRNHRNGIDENVEYIKKALKRYQVWDIVSAPENRRFMHRDIPGLLEKNQRINHKMVTFMDVMLSEVEREQFFPEKLDIGELLQEIKSVWEKDYSWLSIQLNIPEGMSFRSAKDIFRVIFDNLILNTVQQNKDMSMIKIRIALRQTGKLLSISYADEGKGLPEKYWTDPFRILEVHETSREDGHGIGMWIVNNTVINSEGEIKKIGLPPGFEIEFTLGERI